MTTPLRQYLDTNNISDYDFGIMLKIKPNSARQYIWRWAEGDICNPVQEMRERIERVTNGAVPLGCWRSIKKAKKARGK
jgi:hypothetical protein